MRAEETPAIDGRYLMSLEAKPNTPDPLPLAILTFAGLALVVYFLAGAQGLWRAFANPAIASQYNGTVAFLSASPLFLFAWLSTPELRHSGRLRIGVAAAATLIGIAFLVTATAVLAYTIVRPDTFEFAAASYVVFAAFGFLPTLAVTRFCVLLNRDTWTVAAGDHYLNVQSLSPEAKQIVAKHTNGTDRAPPAWRILMLFGNKDRITYRDFQRMCELEAVAEAQIAAVYEQRALNEERRTAEAASRDLAAHRASTGREIAALLNEVEQLRQATAVASAKHRAVLEAEREEKRQALHELARARADLAEARAAAARLEIALKDKDAEVHRATWALDETKAAALREISRVRQEDKNARSRLVADVERLLSAVTRLTHERAVAESTCEALRREAAAPAEATAGERAALVATQVAQQREIDWLRAKRAGQPRAVQEHPPLAKPQTSLNTTHAPTTVVVDVRRTPRPTLVVDNAMALPLFSKSPERHGVPQRRWRRIQKSRYTGGAYT